MSRVKSYLFASTFIPFYPSFTPGSLLGASEADAAEASTDAFGHRAATCCLVKEPLASLIALRDKLNRWIDSLDDDAAQQQACGLPAGPPAEPSGAGSDGERESESVVADTELSPPNPSFPSHTRYTPLHEEAKNSSSGGGGGGGGSDSIPDVTAGSQQSSSLRKRVPWHVWVIFALAILAVSSAGTAFKRINDITPFLRGSWRLFVTSLVLLPGFVFQLCTASGPVRARFAAKPVAILLTLCLSGVCLACHFGAWIWSLDHTTLAHSLLLVCMHPVIIVLGVLLLGRPVSRGEVVGTATAILGTLLLLQDVNSDGNVSISGDLVAFLGAMFFVCYLFCGKTLRQWMPLFLYAFPVTFLSSVVLALVALPAEGASFFSAASDGVFGWVGLSALPWIMYLSFGPGFIGHTGVNYIIQFLPPLVISVAFLLEPLIGTIIGVIFSESDIPQVWTWVGGTVLLVGVVMNVVSGHFHSLHRERHAESTAASLEMQPGKGGRRDSLTVSVDVTETEAPTEVQTSRSMSPHAPPQPPVSASRASQSMYAREGSRLGFGALANRRLHGGFSRFTDEDGDDDNDSDVRGETRASVPRADDSIIYDRASRTGSSVYL